MPTRAQFDGFAADISKNSSSIKVHEEKLNEQARKMANLEASIQRIEQEQITTRRGLVGKINSAIETTIGIDGKSKQTDEAEFDRARRSIRIWPIPGKTREELQRSVLSFLTEPLGLTGPEIGTFEVRRVEADRLRIPSVIFDEVIVQFEDTRLRDRVAGRGIRLAGFIDHERKPTCGIRMEVPSHLLPAFRVLQRYSFSLKRKFPSMKKHIKYDDFVRSIFLQIKIDDSSEWMNISPEEANSSLKRGDIRRNGRLRSALSPENEIPSVRGERTSLSAAEETYRTPGATPVSSWRPPPRPSPME